MLALALFVLYTSLAFGGRTLLHRLRTGSTGFKDISGRPGSLEWVGGVLFVLLPVVLWQGFETLGDAREEGAGDG